MDKSNVTTAMIVPSTIKYVGTQSRTEIDQSTVADYAETFRDDPKALPEITVFYDGVSHWLADGLHRLLAAIQCKLKKIGCIVHKGTQRDAILFSVGANHKHGLRRKNCDKRKAVTMLLQDSEWNGWSDRAIAEQCRVGHDLVAELRNVVKPPEAFQLAETPTETSTHADNPPPDDGPPDDSSPTNEPPKQTAFQLAETPTETSTHADNPPPDDGPPDDSSPTNEPPKQTAPSEPKKRKGTDGKSYPAKKKKQPKVRDPGDDSFKTATLADTTKAQIKIWYDTIARWLGQTPSIDEFNSAFPGKPAYRALHAAKELYEALKAWHGAIK